MLIQEKNSGKVKKVIYSLLRGGGHFSSVTDLIVCVIDLILIHLVYSLIFTKVTLLLFMREMRYIFKENQI